MKAQPNQVILKEVPNQDETITKSGVIVKTDKDGNRQAYQGVWCEVIDVSQYWIDKGSNEIRNGLREMLDFEIGDTVLINRFDSSPFENPSDSSGKYHVLNFTAVLVKR